MPNNWFRPPCLRTTWVPWICLALTLAAVSAFAADDGAGNVDRVYVLDGATISWDLDRQQFHPPTAEQAARIAEELRLWMSAEKAGDDSRWRQREIEVETLSGGVRRARLPLSLMSFAIGRLDGEPAGLCAEGPSSVRAALAAPAVTVVEEE